MSSAAESRVVALVRLARVHNGLLAAAGVAIGAWWGGAGGHDGGRVSQAAAAAIALATYANTFNDWCDIEIDRVAHPRRPLPAGALAPRSALILAGAAAAMAVVAAALLSMAFALVTIGLLAVMTLYSTHLKRMGLVGNLCVAVLASAPFVYGAWAVGAPLAGLPLFALAAPLHFARELAKDLDDVSGDRLRRATLPLTHGAGQTRAIFAGAILIFLLVLAALVVHRPLLGILVVPALCLCVLATRRIVGGEPGGPRLLKAAMVLAIVPFLVIRS